MNMDNRAEHLAAYIKALQAHDWAFEWSDDHKVWTQGRDSLEALRRAQSMIDADFMVWNRLCPEEWRVGSVAAKESA